MNIVKWALKSTAENTHYFSMDEWLAYLLTGDAPMEAMMNAPSHGLTEQESLALAQATQELWDNQRTWRKRFDEVCRDIENDTQT